MLTGKSEKIVGKLGCGCSHFRSECHYEDIILISCDLPLCLSEHSLYTPVCPHTFRETWIIFYLIENKPKLAYEPALANMCGGFFASSSALGQKFYKNKITQIFFMLFVTLHNRHRCKEYRLLLIVVPACC